MRTEDVFRQANEHIRQAAAERTRFVTTAGHESADRGVANVVERHDGYVVVDVGAHDGR